MKWIKLASVLCAVFLVGCANFGKKSLTPEEQAKHEFEASYQEALKVLSSGETEAAAVKLQALNEANPSYAGPLVNLGIIAYKAKELEQAKAYFEQAIVVNAKQKHAHNYLGVIARDAGEFDVAEQHYRQALAADPSYASAIRNLGILLDLYRGKLEEALALYEQYQSLQDEPDARVKDWIFDIKQRLK